MNASDFTAIRKKLDKTQRDLAALLGVSQKAVCSYEQGWRSIPTHVERQLIFLLACKKSRHQLSINCWDIKKCPDEKKYSCPAWEFDSGRFCWFINGTRCDNRRQSNWSDKLQICQNCEMMKGLKA
jgi:DNA-binding XRE family transcriptional regulator